MFFNSMLISVIQLAAYILASAIINEIGNKNLLGMLIIIDSRHSTRSKCFSFNVVFGLSISGTCAIGLYWARDSISTLLLAAGYISLASVSSTTLISSVVSLFPTSTRYVGHKLFPNWISFEIFHPYAARWQFHWRWCSDD